MSIQLLHKSLDYVNKSDGILEKKRKRKLKKSVLLEEKNVVKNLDERFDFDVDSCQIVKKKRDEVHKNEGDVSYLFSNKDAKNGYSFVEQYRDTKPVDLVAHNKRYLKYCEKYKLPSESVQALTVPVLKEGKKKKKSLQERFSLRGTLFDKKPPKPKDNSVFTDEDFANIPRGTGGVIGTKIKKIK